MALKSFERDHIVDYGRAWEWGTLNRLHDSNTRGPAIRNSLYGKNSPRGPAGVCTQDGSGSWSITGDGCLRALADMADRHGHTRTHQHLASIYGYALEFVPWWAQRFQEWPGPGEYGVVEPCWTRAQMEAVAPNTDSDIWRHYGSLGLLLLGTHPEVRSIGGWSDEQIKAFTDHHFHAVTRAGLLGAGEFLRAPYRSDMLIGCAKVYRALGEETESAFCYQLAKTLWRFVLSGDSFVEIAAPSRLFSYGVPVWNEIRRRWEDPWRYGFFHHGGQGWYYGMVSQSMTELAMEAAIRGDLDGVRYALARLLEVGAWCDPRRCKEAALVPLRSANDPERFYNVLMHGWLRGDAPDGAYLTERAVDGGHMLDVAAFEALGPADRFWTGHADKAFHVDAGNWDREWVAPDGTSHPRRHWSDGSYVARQMSLETLNAGGLLQALWATALVNNDRELTRYLEIRMAIDMGGATRTDGLLTLDQLVPEIGAVGQNLVGIPGRAWQWRIKAGWEARAMMIGSTEDRMVSDGWQDGLQVGLNRLLFAITRLASGEL